MSIDAIEAKMNAEARMAMYEASDWLTAGQLSRILNGGKNASRILHEWKRNGRIFAIRQAGKEYFPDYGFNPRAGYQPTPGLAPILELFVGEMDDWEIAIWFASLNSFLDAKRPKDLLLSNPDRVIAAAEDEIFGIQHG